MGWCQREMSDGVLLHHVVGGVLADAITRDWYYVWTVD